MVWSSYRSIFVNWLFDDKENLSRHFRGYRHIIEPLKIRVLLLSFSVISLHCCTDHNNINLNVTYLNIIPNPEKFSFFVIYTTCYIGLTYSGQHPTTFNRILTTSQSCIRMYIC